MNKIKPWILPAAICLLTLILFQTVFLLGNVPSSSMEPAIKQGTYIIGLRHTGTLETGDVIVFKRDGKVQVKRIAACPGDTIYLCHDIYLESLEKCEGEATPLIVPDSCYFVLGDNEANSYDSRFWRGDPFVRSRDVAARVILP